MILNALLITATIALAACGVETGYFTKAKDPPNSNSEMEKASLLLKDREQTASGLFYQNLPKNFSMPASKAEKLLLREYGAVYVARGGVLVPRKIFFKDEADVSSFQREAGMKSMPLGNTEVILQPAALDALAGAVREARSLGLKISPRGRDSARRTFSQTVTLWESRLVPGLRHWLNKKRITEEQAASILSANIEEQVSKILELEEQGIYFSKDLSKSIIYSVAPPGSSQHLAMLAFDVAEFDDSRVRALLNKYGWYQTVVSDLPHFTYLGAKEDELPKLGLRKVSNSGRSFWVPDI